MKPLAIIIATLFSLQAVAQTNVYKQPLSHPVNHIEAVGMTSTTVVYDTAAYLLITPKVANAAPPQGVVEQSGNSLSVTAKAINYNVEIHLTMENNTLHLEAAGMSHIDLCSLIGDTLHLAALMAEAAGMSDINVIPIIKSDNIAYQAAGMASVNYGGSVGTIYKKSAGMGTIDHTTPQQHGGSRYTVSHSHTSYDFDDRSHLNFLWGWNNWGNTSFNGLLSLPEGYEIYTTFSSYQLAWTYDAICTKHFAAGIGIGYESDVYRFTNPYVTIQNNDLVADLDDDLCRHIKDSRFVSRSFNMPIRLAYFANADHSEGFHVAAYVIPGLNFSSKHTGLKYKGSNMASTNPTAARGYIAPYKCDVRLSLGWGSLSIFAQGSLMPLFNSDNTKPKALNQEVYPFKIGFQLGL